MTLTREQVLEMGAGREMNVLVADKIFGVKTPSLQWSPSSDIYDAWDVVEKLQGEWSWEMKMNNEAKEVELRIGKGWATSTNVPLAICRAALLTTIGEGTE